MRGYLFLPLGIDNSLFGNSKHNGTVIFFEIAQIKSYHVEHCFLSGIKLLAPCTLPSFVSSEFCYMLRYKIIVWQALEVRG